MSALEEALRVSQRKMRSFKEALAAKDKDLQEGKLHKLITHAHTTQSNKNVNKIKTNENMITRNGTYAYTFVVMRCNYVYSNK